MADAEVKLNFTADVERAKAELNAMRVMLDELSAAFKKVSDYFSSESAPGDDHVELLEMMTAEVERLRAAYESLQEQFANSQKANAEMSSGYLAQISELRKAMQDALDKVRELNGVIDEQNDKIEKQGDRIKELEKKTKDSHRTGINGYRSLRSVVGDFIVQLFKGKVAVNELGVALKGLAYSTVVLGAIQLAMDGIGLAWKGIKSLFTESKEEMEAAEEAAKKAQEELADAKRAAEKAAGEVQRLKEKLAEKEEAETLKETLAAITGEYVAQRDAVNATLAALKEQAQVKARERAAEAAAKTGELDMELLDLEERFVNGDIGKRDYIVQKAEIEKRKREEARVAAVDSAEIAKDAAEAERDRARAELAESRKREASLLDELGKYSSPDESEIAAGEYNKTRMQRKDFEAQMDKARSDFYQKYGSQGEIDENGKFVFKSGFDEFLQENGGLMFSQDEFDEQLRHINYLTGKVSALRERERTQKDAADAAAKGAKQYKETARRLEEERKTAAGLEKTAKTAEDGARKANAALAETLAKTAREGGQDDRMTGKRVDIEIARIDKDEKTKEDAKRGQLQAKLDKLMGDVQMAADTQKLDDDMRAVDAVDKFVTANAEAMLRYGVDVSRLISLTDKLRLIQADDQRQMNSIRSRLDALERDVQRNANFNKKS